MNIVESYALQCGAKISKPYIHDAFFPLPFEKFITIQPWSKNSKNYDYWQEVIALIFPYLESNKIKIVQMGAGEEPILPGCYSVIGRTTFNQCANIIKRSLLHFGADSFAQHFAGGYGVPLVDLVSNNYAECVRPFFGDINKQIIIEPDRTEGERPSFAIDEGPDKQINRIKPEKVAVAILDLLKITHTINQKTLNIGKFFNNTVFESVPNALINIEALGNPEFYIRADLECNLPMIDKQLAIGRSSLVTSKPIPMDILLRNKANLAGVIYILWDGYDLDFIKSCADAGIKLNLGSFKDKDWINKQKLHLHKYGIIFHFEKKKKEDFEFLKDIDNSQLYFKSNKFLLSNQKFYPSKAHYLAGRNIEKLEVAAHPIIDNDEFWFDHQHYYFLTKQNN